MNFKLSYVAAVLLAFLMTVTFFTETKAQSMNQISAAIQTANSRELARHFDSNVELTIIANEGMYSKAQAEQIVKDFFSKYPPRSFDIIHQGSSDRGSMYGIGTLVTSKQTFRTYIYILNESNGFLIQQIRFEED